MNNKKSIERIMKMESILVEANRKIDELEEKIEELKGYQDEIKELSDYYSSDLWKEDFELDERGELPKDLKRGVLSEDGIYDMLERNNNILKEIHSK